MANQFQCLKIIIFPLSHTLLSFRIPQLRCLRIIRFLFHSYFLGWVLAHQQSLHWDMEDPETEVNDAGDADYTKGSVR
jgi:hypothetical protein